MRYIIILTLCFPLVIPLEAIAITGQNTRFDWSLGQPTITANVTDACNDTAKARFDWSLGQPTIVLDATANCTSSGSDPASPPILYFKNSDLRYKNADLRYK